MSDITPRQTAPGKRERNKEEVRTRIADEIIQLLSEGMVDISHDLIAARTGISRRTIYRYFPDKDALLQGGFDRVRALAGSNVVLPRGEADLVDTLHDIYTGFDRIAPIATLVRSTPQGRALRRSATARRAESYTAATAEVVKALLARDQLLATAVLQFLHTTGWLEMRDQWGLSGEEMARGVGWAMRTLLRDLRKRDGTPLDRDVD